MPAHTRKRLQNDSSLKTTLALWLTTGMDWNGLFHCWWCRLQAGLNECLEHTLTHTRSDAFVIIRAF